MKALALTLVAVAALSACSGTSTKVAKDGTASELSWPNPTSTSFNKDRGTYPNLENLSKIRSGMSKDELYDLIGRPQFTEGFRVREWNYLFHFNTPGQGTQGVASCQYKVLFDSKKYARSFHWRAVDPVDAVCPPPAPAPVVQQAEPQVIVREIVQTPARIRQ